MKIKSVKLCGQTIDIEYDDSSNWNSNAMGRMLPIKGKIILSKDLSSSIEQSVLLHEVLHFIADTQEILDLKLDNETVISILANSLLAFIKDNKKLIEYLKEE